MNNILIFPEFEDFNEAYKEVNKAFLVNPDTSVEYIRGAQGLTEDIFITVRSPSCTIALEEIGYSSGHKWSTLINTYIDFDELEYFKKQFATTRGLSITYRFKSKKKNNGGCLTAITLTRNDSKESFQRAKVIWRTSEIQRRWLADLILIDRFFDHINFQPKLTTLYLCQAYQSWLHTAPLAHIFGVDIEDLDQKNIFTKRVYDSYHRVYNNPDRPPAKYSPTLRMQMYHQKRLDNELDKPIDPKSLKIKQKKKR